MLQAQDWPLFRRISTGTSTDSSSDQILDLFLDYTQEKKLDLYPAQEEALLELYSGKDVILKLPPDQGSPL